MTTQGYSPISVALQPTPQAMRAIGVMANHMLEGRLNVLKAVTLAPNAFTTTINDPRLSGVTALYFGARTANAAVCAPTIWYDTKAKGSVVVHHQNSPAADKTYDILIIG